MKKLVVAIPVLALALGGTTACATKKMVKTEVGEVNGKVETLSKTVEETQERTRTNEGKINEVDQKAQSAGQRADAANKSAADARAAADKVNTRADEIERSAKRLVYEVTLSEDKGGFKFGKAAMPDQAKADLDQLVEKLKASAERCLHRNRRPHRQRRSRGLELQARARARRGGQAVSLRPAPGAAPQDQRDQLRRREADRAEQDQGRPRAEPPRRHQGPDLNGRVWICAPRVRGSTPVRWTGSGAQEVTPEWSGGDIRG